MQYRFIDCCSVLKWFVFDQNPDHIMQYHLRVEFALKVLNETKSIEDLSAPNVAFSAIFRELTRSEFTKKIVRHTVLRLWRKDRDCPLLERFLVGLVESHGLLSLFLCLICCDFCIGISNLIHTCS